MSLPARSKTCCSTAPLIALTVALGIPVAGQEVHPRLAVIETTTMPSIPDQSTLIPIKTDSDGNMYVRFYQVDFGRAAVTKILRNSETVTYHVSLIPRDAYKDKDEWQNATMPDFAPTPSGALSSLIATGARNYLAEFSAKGEYEGLHELRLGENTKADSVSFWQLVVLPNQRFFVSGVMSLLSKSGGKRTFNAIFDGNGGLISEVALKGDLAPSVKKDSDQEDNRIDGDVQTGSALAGDDGNIYLMRSVVPAKVFVVSAGGQLLRVVPVALPLDHASVDTFKVHHGTIAVEFSRPTTKDKPDEIIFRIINGTTGELIGDYMGSAETSRWVDYTDDGLIFLGAKDKKLARIRAVVP